MNHHERKATEALLHDVCGQRIVRAELGDDGCVGLTLETGELTLVAQLEHRRDDIAPRLSVAWQLFTAAARL